ncbi:MAG TPA: glycosyltransferase [Acidimicrobiales bacterium]|nr:glycosyltransferase [Acidimicrobiales bacterium]
MTHPSSSPPAGAAAPADGAAALAPEERVPPVVAVVVTRDPGPHFDEVLASLAAQDYGDLSVLVLDSGGTVDPTARVAAVLPDAFVRRLPLDRGFGAAANEVLGMVEGAAFFLFCHDDCRAAPDAVHVMVGESYRSNAGVVTPKMLRVDDPSVLLHVGMAADKTGAVVDRVQPGEVDQGQHDSVRDVFIAPGGFTLVRADLFEQLGGFDPTIVALGEDLDLSWRAHVAGARVVVAPEAKVYHAELVAGGAREVAWGPDGEPPPPLAELQRRHELRAVLKCYGRFHRLRVVPQLLFLNAGEYVVARVARDRDRAAVIIAAWRWNLAHRKQLRELRRSLRAVRVLSDSDVRRMQLRGSARLSTYTSRLVHQGYDTAHARTAESATDDDAEPVLTGSVGLAFSEDADFDELDDLGRRSGRDRFGRRRRRPFLSRRRSRLVVWLVATLVLLIGTRNILAAHLPLIGQYLPPLDWSASWHQFFSPWQTPGVGTTAPAAPAFAVLGTVGTVLLGAMGLTQKVLVLACFPVGAMGLSRLLRPFVSPRARLAGALGYLGLALAYNSLAEGRWDGLVAYAVVPWVLVRLARAGGAPPFGLEGAGWRTTLLGQMVTLGVVEAVAVAFAPGVAPLVLLCSLGLAVGSYVMGNGRGAGRTLAVGAGATVAAAVLLFPWVVGTLLAGRGAVNVFGLPASPSGTVGWSALVRFAVGPTGGSPLGWLLVLAALLPLVIGRHARLAWAGRFWTLACGSWFLAWLVSRGYTGAFAPPVQVLLAPAAAGVAAALGLGVAAFEQDLAGYHFGWRQVLSAVTVVVALVGLAPVAAEAANGRWGMPAAGYASSLGFLGQGAATPYRVLWLGNPRALPLGGWSMQSGLAYGTSVGGVPDGTDTWAPAGAGPTVRLATSVELAREGLTTHLGRLLAPAAVRYIVVVENLAPSLGGLQSSASFPTPPDLVPTLLGQRDLLQVPTGDSSFDVFLNTATLPLRAARATGPVTLTRSVPAANDLTGWQPALPAGAGPSSWSGPLSTGTAYAGYAPAGGWTLQVGGKTVPMRSAFGWAAQYPVAAAGPASLHFDGSPLVPLAVTLEVLGWLALAVALLWRASWVENWRARRDEARSDKATADERTPAAALAGGER